MGHNLNDKTGDGSSTYTMDRLLAKINEHGSNNNFINAIGVEFLKCENGMAEGRLKLVDMIKNPFGQAHGGCLFSLADTVAGSAAMTRGNYVTTLSASIEYLRPGLNTEYLYARAEEVKNGNTILVYDVMITDDNGNKLTKATFSFYRMKPIE